MFTDDLLVSITTLPGAKLLLAVLLLFIFVITIIKVVAKLEFKIYICTLILPVLLSAGDIYLQRQIRSYYVYQYALQEDVIVYSYPKEQEILKDAA